MWSESNEEMLSNFGAVMSHHVFRKNECYVFVMMGMDSRATHTLRCFAKCVSGVFLDM